MPRKFIPATLVASVAAIGLTAAPAQANSLDFEDVLTGIAALAIIASVLDDDGPNRGHAVGRHHGPRFHQPPRPRTRTAPPPRARSAPPPQTRPAQPPAQNNGQVPEWRSQGFNSYGEWFAVMDR